MLVLLLVTVLLDRHSAERVGLVPDGASARTGANTAPANAGTTIGDAVRESYGNYTSVIVGVGVGVILASVALWRAAPLPFGSRPGG
jgi:hypothetical protein